MFDEFYLKNSENSGELGKIFDTLITKKEDLKKFCLNKIKENKKDISDFFSNLISELQKKYFKDGKFIENFDIYTNNVFLIEQVMMDFFKNKEKSIPANYFELINSIFVGLHRPEDPDKKIDSKKKIEFIKKIILLFDKYIAYPFFLKFFNELFEILIYYSAIEQDVKVNDQGKLLGELFIDYITVNNDYFDTIVKLISEKIKLDQPVLAKFLEDWVGKIITLSSDKNCLGNILIDFMPWIMKKKNSDIYNTMKKKFLSYIEILKDINPIDIKENIEQIRKCIFTLINLIINQKESNQQDESFLNELIIKMVNMDINEEIIEEIFPFDTINLFILLILRSKDYNKNIITLNKNLKELIEKIVVFKNIKTKEFKETIEEGINNPILEQKENALDWYLFIYEKNNKNIIESKEPYKEIINIIINYIDKNLEDKKSEILFLLMLDKLYKDNILILFDLLTDTLKNEKHNYLFDYNISGFLCNFLIVSDRAKQLREELSTPKKKKNDNNIEIELFEKIYKIFSVNPMCLLIFCIYMKEYELGWELILNFKNIKLEDDYYKYLARFSQAIDNKKWNDIRFEILKPNENIYFIKCLYGVLMLLPQGKAFRILSDRLYSIKELLKSKNHIDNNKNEDDINYKKQINKFIELFFDVQKEYKK